MESISGKARRHLKALGHHLQPVVLVGKEGMSDALVAAIKRALLDHELIKVKLGESVEGARKEVAAALAVASKSEMVAITGRTLLLYKRNPQKTKIELPDAKAKKSGKGEKSDKAAVKTAGKGQMAAPKKAGKTAKKAAPAVKAASDDSDTSFDDVTGEDDADDDGDFGDDD